MAQTSPTSSTSSWFQVNPHPRVTITTFLFSPSLLLPPLSPTSPTSCSTTKADNLPLPQAAATAAAPATTPPSPLSTTSSRRSCAPSSVTNAPTRYSLRSHRTAWQGVGSCARGRARRGLSWGMWMIGIAMYVSSGGGVVVPSMVILAS